MIHFMLNPLQDDMGQFLEVLKTEHVNGEITSIDYYVSLGKAMAYAECRFSLGMLTKREALNMLLDIKTMIFPERKEIYDKQRKMEV